MRRHVLLQAGDPPESPVPVALRRLWVAALEGCVTDLRCQAEPNRSPNEAHPGLERAWLFSDAMRPGAYLWICRLLDLEPTSLRRGILAGSPRWRPTHGEQVRQGPKMGARAGRTRRER